VASSLSLVASSLSSVASSSSSASSVSSPYSSAGSSAAASATPAKIEVTSTTVLLTAPNQTQPLKARVLDEKGNEIAATVTWESSNPAGISIDSNGVIAAGGSDASAQITASIGTLKSIPLLVAYTQIANGAVLLTDTQIVGDPVETDPNAAFNVNNTYSIKLSGVAAPSVGQVVVNSGNKPVVGRVKAVSTLAGVHTVTLGMVSVKEALPNLHIKESFDLRNLPVQIPAAVLADYDVVREGSSFTYTPKVAISANTKPQVLEKMSLNASPASALASGEIGKSIQCEFTIEGIAGKGSPPIKLNKLPSLKVDFNPHLDLDYNPIDGLKVLMLRAQPTITIDSTFEFDASIDPKLTCTLELETFVAPAGGPFAALLGPSVTFYGGIEVSTKTSLKGVKLGAVATISNTLGVGIRDCSFMGCSTVSEATIPKAGVTTVMSELAENYRFEPSVFVYGMAKLGIANPLLKSLRVEAVYAKLGPAVNASLARPDGQIMDPAYLSNYSIDAQLKAGLDTVFKQAAFLFGINGLTENLIDLKWPITQSPTGKATADVSSFKAGDKVNIDVQLDPENVTFLDFYNVKRVLILRKTGSSPAVEVASNTPNVEGATKFNLSYTAQSDGQSSELYAFVQTNDTILASLLNGLPLEIGRVKAYAPERGRLITKNVGYQAHGAVCALSVAGDLQCWGALGVPFGGVPWRSNNLLDGPTSLQGFGVGLKAIAESYRDFKRHLCAITLVGDVKCVFMNDDGTISSPAAIPGLINIKKFSDFCGVNADQQLWCINSANEAYQVKNLPPIIDVFYSRMYFAKTEAGILIPLINTLGDVLVPDSTNLDYPGRNDVLSFAPSNTVLLPCVVKTNAEVQCLDYPDFLGRPQWKTVSNTPANTVIFARVGYQGFADNHTKMLWHTPWCAVTREGAISCTGTIEVTTTNIVTFDNGCQNLRRDIVELDSLVKAANMKNIVDISLSQNLLCAVNNKNEVSCVGENWSGQLGYKSIYPILDQSGCQVQG
jgi:hypothetical protein